MATRLRYNGVVAALASGLSSGATSMTLTASLKHNGGTNVPTVASPDILPVSILDENGVLAEIIHITAYTSGGTTATILRGREGTTAKTHASGSFVLNAPTILDEERFATATGGGREDTAAFSGTSGTVVGDLDLANWFYVTPTGNITLSFTNIPASGEGCTITAEINHPSGTIRTLTMPAGTTWIEGQSTPVLRASKWCMITLLTRDGGSSFKASAVQQA